MHLITKFPIQYLEAFMLPNAVKYFVPPTEFLGEYNMGKDSVDKLAKDWFNYKTRKVQQHDKKKRNEIAATEWFPVFGAIANILLVMGLIGVALLGAINRKEYGLPQLLTIILALWLLNGFYMAALVKISVPLFWLVDIAQWVLLPGLLLFALARSFAILPHHYGYPWPIAGKRRLLLDAGLTSSLGESRRAIEQGGVYLNNVRVDDVAATLDGATLAGGMAVLRRGKKTLAGVLPA